MTTQHSSQSRETRDSRDSVESPDSVESRGSVVAWPTVGQCAEAWLARTAARGTLSPATLVRTRQCWERYLAPWLAARPVRELTGAQVQDWMQQLLTVPKDPPAVVPLGHPFHRRATGLAPATVRAAWQLLGRILDAAVAAGLVHTNAARAARPPHRPGSGGPRWRPWTAPEALRFLDSARRDRDLFYPAYALILLAGLRVHEALGLAWADVDLTSGTARIGHGLHTNGSTGTVRRPIRASARTPNPWGPIRLPDPCVALLRHHHASTAPHPPGTEPAAGRRRSTRPGQPAGGLVVTSVWGRPVAKAYFGKRFRARARLAGVRIVPAAALGPTTPALLVALHIPPAITTGIVDRRHLPPRQLTDAVTLATGTRPARPSRTRR